MTPTEIAYRAPEYIGTAYLFILAMLVVAVVAMLIQGAVERDEENKRRMGHDLDQARRAKK